jgi:predicted deacylase
VPTVRRRVLEPGGVLGDVQVPCVELRGDEDGPSVALIAGVHGCEYTSMLALRRLVRTLDPAQVRGRILVVPVVNVTAFRARTAFVVPEDGRNLNRVFPGRRGGSAAEQLACCVFDEVVGGADALVDLHAGDLPEELEPFAMYDQAPGGGSTEVEATARRMAEAYGLGYVVRHPRQGGPVGGTSTEAAAAVGIPGITAESGGRGLVEEDAVARHLWGVTNVLRLVGALSGAYVPPARPPVRVDRFVWLRTRSGGWWEPAVHTGARVEEGDLLGTVSDLFGDELERVISPAAGVPLFVTSSPAVAENGLVLGLGACAG